MCALPFRRLAILYFIVYSYHTPGQYFYTHLLLDLFVFLLLLFFFSAFFSVFGKRVARREFVLICAQKLFNKNADNGTVN